VSLRRRGLAFLHHVEVVVERRDFVDLGLASFIHSASAFRCAAGEVPEAILDAVQVLDQVIALARRAFERRAISSRATGIDGAALRNGTRAADLGNRDDDVGHVRAISLAGRRPGGDTSRRDRGSCESGPWNQRLSLPISGRSGA
jgi:hypothetical protein